MPLAFRPGVLSYHQLLRLCDEGVIKNSPDPQRACGPSAIDLTLSSEGYLMKGAIKGQEGRPYLDVVGSPRYLEKSLDLSSPVTLHPHQTAVVRLNEELDLSQFPYLHGYASGKSSIGRLDVLVRLIADYASGYDEVVPAIRSGESRLKLYAEITPISFPIQIRRTISLNQLRFFSGEAHHSELSTDLLKLYPNLLLNSTGGALGGTLSELTVDLTPVQEGKATGLIGFCAKERVNAPIDVSGEGGPVDPSGYFDPVLPNRESDTLEIIPERFYILRSRERFRLPPDVAVFVQAMSERLGELRIHYAGFVHPGFGYFRPQGTPLIFETRGHNLTTFLRHGERMAVIRYYRMSEPVDEEVIRGESYQFQELTLSRHFSDWGGGSRPC